MIAAVAISFAIPFIFKIGLVEFVAYAISIILLYYGIKWANRRKQRYKRCTKIILDAEKRILFENNIEAKTEPETKTTNITSPIVMINEKEYWERIIAIGVLVFAIYPFTKDFFNDYPHILKVLEAYFAAIFIALIIFIVSCIALKKELNK